jgi:hypothetical protein
MRYPTDARRLFAIGFAMAVLSVGLLAVPAGACQTPVYRYAMYNWPASPYYVFYFHHGEIPAADTELHDLIESLATNEKAPANLLLEKIDVSKEKALERYPEAVREVYEAHPDKEKPFHAVFSPWGVVFQTGGLDEDSLKAMVDSPARKKIGQLLHEGHLTVMVLLPGKDKGTNEQAEKAAKKLIADLESGEIDLGPDPAEVPDPYGYGYGPPPSEEPAGGPDGEAAEPGTDESADEAPDAAAEEKKPVSKIERKAALVKLARDDPAEKWFIKALMQVEPDLDEYADEPMVFGVYGRGRALPPFVGKGITADNLVDLLFFLSGSCSCQIKEQNPGMDLPMAWNWDAAAEAIAATDPEFAMDPYGYGYADDPAETPEDTGPEAQEPTAGDDGQTEPSEELAVAADDGTPGEHEPAAGAEEPAEPAPASGDDGEKAVALVTEAPSAEPADGTATTAGTQPTDSAASRVSWMIGLGIALGAVLIVGAGFAVLRRHPV